MNGANYSLLVVLIVLAALAGVAAFYYFGLPRGDTEFLVPPPPPALPPPPVYPEPSGEAPPVSGELTVSLETQLGSSVSAFGVTIMPLQIIEDSRCPVDVTCIQEGTVRVRARVVSGTGESDTVFKLGYPVTTEAEQVELVYVQPEPHSSRPLIAPSEYRLWFKISKRQSLGGPTAK